VGHESPVVGGTPHGVPWGIAGAGGRLDSRRRTAAAVLGPLPPNRRRPGADPGPLAGFLSVRSLEILAIDDGALDHRQVGGVVLEL